MAATAVSVSAEIRRLYLARVEFGRRPVAVPIDGASVRLPQGEHGGQRDKARARIEERQPRAWLFDAARTGLGVRLCQPGAAAIDETPAAAIEAAMKLLSQYQRARTSKR